MQDNLVIGIALGISIVSVTISILTLIHRLGWI